MLFVIQCANKKQTEISLLGLVAKRVLPPENKKHSDNVFGDPVIQSATGQMTSFG